MVKPDVIKAARRFRLELVMLGVALARDGDRELVLREVNPDDLQSPLVGECLKAVSTQSPEDVDRAIKIFKQWGLEVDGSVTESLIRKITNQELAEN